MSCYIYFLLVGIACHGIREGLGVVTIPTASTLQRSSSHCGRSAPPPPVRRTPSMTKSPVQGDTLLRIDDDETPHGSVENLMPDPLEEMAQKASNVAESLHRFHGNSGILRRSTSMSNGPNSPQRDTFSRRSFTMSNNNNPGHSSTNTSGNPDPSRYQRVSTHHIIPIRGDKPSPDAEIYGFGQKFRENSRQYFKSETAPLSKEAIQNQLFLDSLSAKLTDSVNGQQKPTGHLQSKHQSFKSMASETTKTSTDEQEEMRILAKQIENGSLNLQSHKLSSTDFI